MIHTHFLVKIVFMRALITSFCLSLCLALSGCGSAPLTAKEIEPQIKADIDKAQAQGGLQPTRSISLIDSGPNRYEGFVELSDNSRVPLTVVRQDDGETIWKLSN
ncbi:MAG: hypothetical protein KY445_06345 [Armatimonadetes bacterium]|nr:hypothetical protein [Armatimonadota bacterium]